MDSSTWKQVEEIYSLIWNTKYKEAEEKVTPLIHKHPVFGLLQCEITVAVSLLAERKEDYARGIRDLIAVKKGTSELWRLRRPVLKQYQAELGAETAEQKVDDDKDEGQAAEEAGTIDADALVIEEDASQAALLTESGIDLRQVSSALWARAISAEIQFMSAAVYFRQQKYLKGALDFKRSWNTYKEIDQIFQKLSSTERAAQQIPQFNEIRCLVDYGVGLFNFICSVVPRHFLFIVEGIGFQADRVLAMDLLKRSMRCETSFRSHIASLCLAWIYAFFYDQSDVTFQILVQEIENFPQSALLAFTYAYVLRKEGKLQESTEYFQRAKEAGGDVPEFQLKIEYELGCNLYLQLQWEPAAQLLTYFLNNNQTEAFRTYCAYQIAFCYAVRGNNEQATVFMKKIQPWVRKNYVLDEYAGRQAKKFLKKKQFSEYTLIYEQAFILQEACQYNQVLELLEQARSKENGLEDQAMSIQLRGSAFAKLKKYTEAKADFNRITKQEKAVSKVKGAIFTIPFSWAGLAEIAVIEGDVAAADAALKKAKSYSNYDFESFLIWRVRKTEEDLRKLRQQQTRQ